MSELPEMSRRTFRWSVWAIRIAGIIITLWLLGFLYSQSVPYSPYRVDNYAAVPGEVCENARGGEQVRVNVTRYADENGNIQSITTRTYWQEVSTNASPGITEFVTVWRDRDDVSYGKQTVESNILREIPTAPGTYRIVSEYDVRGRVLIFDRTDSYQLSSRAILTVLPEDAPECRADEEGA